jgi:putative Holliday junction resolvase|tara:strand:- start:1531 stop:1974 length:444 start_codon:yes stop_codon:yes gene_type:complete
MVIDNISEFLINNKYRSKFLSIDFGLKYLGLAISDDTNLIAIPFKTLNESELLAQFQVFIRKQNIYGFIIGKPYNLDGSSSKMIENVNIFIQKLLKIKDIPIYLIDERLSSKQYKRHDRISKMHIHEKSACLILDDFLALYQNYKND